MPIGASPRLFELTMSENFICLLKLKRGELILPLSFTPLKTSKFPVNLFLKSSLMLTFSAVNPVFSFCCIDSKPL